MTRMRRLGQLAVLVFTVIGCVARASAPPAQIEPLSIEHLAINAHERIVGFEFAVHSARVVSMRDIPAGWDVRIQNNPSWKAVVTGSALVGAAAVGPQFFARFMRIERNESLGLDFGISGSVVVTQDFIKERHIAVSTKDVTVTR